MAQHKSKEQREQEQWYISRAYLKLQEATNYSSLFKYAESVNSSYESIEFSIKALCKLLDVEFSFSHFPDELTIVKLSEKIGIKWPEKKEKLLTVLPIVLSYSDRLREIARYRVEDKQKRVPCVSPNRIFQQEYHDKVLSDAKRLVDILSQIEKSFRWNLSRPIKLGILNGYIRDPTKEKHCSEYVWTLREGHFWKDYFSEIKKNGQLKYQVEEINASEITDEFAVILNPFGETYPEYSVDDRKVYNQIKLFVQNGGVFINTAGFAFFMLGTLRKVRRNQFQKREFFSQER